MLTTSAGIALAIAMSVGIAMIWPFDISSPEIASRTRVGLDSVALALASGAAAALSLTTGLSSVLGGAGGGGPAATRGHARPHAGLWRFQPRLRRRFAFGHQPGGVNLACKVVFMIKGIHPRTWMEKEKAKHAMVIYILSWVVTLIFLIFVIYSRRELVG